MRRRPIFEEQRLAMTETVPTRPFDDMEALSWLRSQPDGRVTASAAELARRWGWNRMRTGRRLKAWLDASHIRRNAEAIILTTPVTPTVTEVPGVTAMPRTTEARRSMTSVKLATFIVALALACVSAAFSIDGLTAIFAGAFWPVITMGAALEAGKLVAAAWLTEHWHSAPPFLRMVLVTMIGVLMSLNAVGVFGFLTRASGFMPTINGMAAIDLVSLPGMMTGQILAGVEPIDAVKYQLLIMFLIAGGTGLRTLAAVMGGGRLPTNHRLRLRLDRIAADPPG
jgi:Uncharacterised protein family (UPF0014)